MVWKILTFFTQKKPPRLKPLKASDSNGPQAQTTLRHCVIRQGSDNVFFFKNGVFFSEKPPVVLGINFGKERSGIENDFLGWKNWVLKKLKEFGVASLGHHGINPLSWGFCCKTSRLRQSDPTKLEEGIRIFCCWKNRPQWKKSWIFFANPQSQLVTHHRVWDECRPP